jgi:hypothetical protein
LGAFFVVILSKTDGRDFGSKKARRSVKKRTARRPSR